MLRRMTKQYQILLPLPDGVLSLLEDYRASFRPVLSKRAAINRLIGEGLLRWASEPSEEQAGAIANEVANG